MRVWVIIPALNEQHAIVKVLGSLGGLSCGISEVIVVDNGSVDGTSVRAREAGAVVLRENRRGYGRACLCGLRYVALRAEAGDVVVFLDADYSDYPEELPLLLAPIIEKKADFVLGSRVLGRREKGAMNRVQRWGNAFSLWLFSYLYGHFFTDMGPFRAIRYRDLQRLEMRDLDYGWNIEMQLKAVKKGLRCMEVPVSYRKRLGYSKISGTLSGVLQAGSKIIYTLFRYYRLMVSLMAL